MIPIKESFMKLVRLCLLVLAVVSLSLTCRALPAQAKADVVELYAHAVMTADVEALDKLLAPNYWHISANGHIQDKEHFLDSLKNKRLVINHLTITNVRRSIIGNNDLLTGNGILRGMTVPPLPQGLMRYSLVLTTVNGKEQIVLFQATPVVPSETCKDGNCAIR